MNCLTEKELYWIAGLLEGEGYFCKSSKGYPKISLLMTDKDVIEKISLIVGHGNICGPYFDKRPNRKPSYQWHLIGARAETLMKQLYPVMGIRRRARLDSILRSPAGTWHKP